MALMAWTPPPLPVVYRTPEEQEIPWTQDWWTEDWDETLLTDEESSSTFKVALWPKQLEFFDCPDLFAAYVGGIGSGKSHVGVVTIVVYMLEHAGARGVVVGPTLRNVKESTLRKFFELVPRVAIERWWASDMRLRFKNGSEITFWGSNVDDVVERMRGMEIAYFWIDEAALCPAVLMDVLPGRLRQRDADAQPYPYRGRMSTTHKGKDWTYQKFEPDDPARAPIGRIWHTSIYENEDLPAEYVRSVEILFGDTEYAKQELLGLHAKYEGLVYPTFDRATHVVSGPLPHFKRVVFGIDWGFHYAPVIAVGVMDDDRLMVCAEYYGRRITIDQQIGLERDPSGEYAGALGLCRDLGVRPDDVDCYPDPSRPENIVTWVQKGKGLACPEYERGHITEGVLEVARHLRVGPGGVAGLVFHSSCVFTIAELEGYRRKERAGYAIDDPQRFDEEPAPGQLDHAMDALRYSLQGLKQAGYSQNAINYMLGANPPCVQCNRRFHWPLSAQKATCPNCGHEHVR